MIKGLICWITIEQTRLNESNMTEYRNYRTASRQMDTDWKRTRIMKDEGKRKVGGYEQIWELAISGICS